MTAYFFRTQIISRAELFLDDPEIEHLRGLGEP
jgi:hypothetical protein